MSLDRNKEQPKISVEWLIKEAVETYKQANRAMENAVGAQEKANEGLREDNKALRQDNNALREDNAVIRQERDARNKENEDLMKKIKRSHAYNKVMTIVAIGAIAASLFVWHRGKAGSLGYRQPIAQIDDCSKHREDVRQQLDSLKKKDAAHDEKDAAHDKAIAGILQKLKALSGTRENRPAVPSKDEGPDTSAQMTLREPAAQTKPKEAAPEAAPAPEKTRNTEPACNVPEYEQRTPERVFEVVSLNELKQRFKNSTGSYWIRTDYIRNMFKRVEGTLDCDDKRFMFYSDKEISIVKYGIGDQGISVEISYPDCNRYSLNSSRGRVTVTVPPGVDNVTGVLAAIFNVSDISRTRSLNVIEQKLQEAVMNGKSSAPMSGNREVTFECTDGTLTVTFDSRGGALYTYPKDGIYATY